MTTEKINIPYETPEILTFSEEELFEEIAFAQGCSPSPCPTP
jgi:hypothetical protein